MQIIGMDGYFRVIGRLRSFSYMDMDMDMDVFLNSVITIIVYEWSSLLRT
jgi:hypothetical protein